MAKISAGAFRKSVQGACDNHEDVIRLEILSKEDRIFGADNSGGFWHWHPYGNATQHPEAEISFAEFLAQGKKKRL